MSERLEPRAVWALLGTLGALVVVNVPVLGSDPWPFHPLSVRAHGILGPIVRAADGEWDLGTIRTPAVLAGLAVALTALVAVRGRTLRTDVLVSPETCSSTARTRTATTTTDPASSGSTQRPACTRSASRSR